jgi:hypothetical protein
MRVVPEGAAVLFAIAYVTGCPALGDKLAAIPDSSTKTRTWKDIGSIEQWPCEESGDYRRRVCVPADHTSVGART